MFCPGCKTEFEIDGDELQILRTGIKCPNPECDAITSFTTLKEWVKTDIKKLKEEMDAFIDEYFSQEKKYAQSPNTMDNIDAFNTFKKRWHTEIAEWFIKEGMLSHIILNYLLYQKALELEEKRGREISDLRSVYRTKFLCWRNRRDFDALETDPLFYLAPGEEITTILKSNNKPDYKAVISAANTSKPLVFLSNEIWIELFTVWFCFNEDINYLMEKAESLLAADQLDSNWYREEAAWVDLYSSLVILKPQWHRDMDRWLSCFGEPSQGKKEECLEKLAQVKRKRSQEVK